MIPPELEKRYDELVSQLRLLTEASSQSIVAFSVHGKQESRPPSGIQPDKRIDEWGGPYDPDRAPLLLWFLWRWEKAPDDRARRAAVVEAELRLQRRRRPQPGRVAGGTLDGETVEVPAEASAERDERIATAYEGLPPADVAVIESESYGWCSQANIRKVRRLAGRDPETGLEQAGMENEREYALELRRQGHSERSIAMRLSKPRSTVQYWLRPDSGAA